MPRLAFNAAAQWVLAAGESQDIIIVPPGDYGTGSQLLVFTQRTTSNFIEYNRTELVFSDASTYILEGTTDALQPGIFGTNVFNAVPPWSALLSDGFSIRMVMPETFTYLGTLQMYGATSFALVLPDPEDLLAVGVYNPSRPSFNLWPVSSPLPIDAYDTGRLDHIVTPTPYLILGALGVEVTYIEPEFPFGSASHFVQPTFDSNFPLGGQYESYQSLFPYEARDVIGLPEFPYQPCYTLSFDETIGPPPLTPFGQVSLVGPLVALPAGVTSATINTVFSPDDVGPYAVGAGLAFYDSDDPDAEPLQPSLASSDQEDYHAYNATTAILPAGAAFYRFDVTRQRLITGDNPGDIRVESVIDFYCSTGPNMGRNISISSGFWSIPDPATAPFTIDPPFYTVTLDDPNIADPFYRPTTTIYFMLAFAAAGFVLTRRGGGGSVRVIG